MNLDGNVRKTLVHVATMLKILAENQRMWPCCQCCDKILGWIKCWLICCTDCPAISTTCWVITLMEINGHYWRCRAFICILMYMISFLQCSHTNYAITIMAWFFRSFVFFLPTCCLLPCQHFFMLFVMLQLKEFEDSPVLNFQHFLDVLICWKPACHWGGGSTDMTHQANQCMK